MYITLVNSWYPPHSGFGGIAMYNYYLSRALVHLGHQVTVLAIRWDDKVPYYECVDGVEVYRLLVQKSPYWLQRLPIIGHHVRSLRRVWYSVRIALKLTALGKECPADVIEFAETEAEGVIYLHHSRRSPVVVRCHTPTAVLQQHYLPEEISYNTKLLERLEAVCVHKAEGVTTPSQDMAQVISATFAIPRDKIKPIPNLLDVDLFGSGIRAQRHDEGKIIFLHVGRLERVKGITILAEAIPNVVADIPNACFLFVGGDRPYQGNSSWSQQLQQRLAANGCRDHVQFLGDVSLPQLIECYHQADVAVVPSLNYESFSYTCAQAMAAGLPVVSSRIGGIPETVPDGEAGILVEPGDVQALAQALIQLGNDRATREQMGRVGYRRAKSQFDSPIVAQQMVELYQSLIEKG